MTRGARRARAAGTAPRPASGAACRCPACRSGPSTAIEWPLELPEQSHERVVRPLLVSVVAVAHAVGTAASGSLVLAPCSIRKLTSRASVPPAIRPPRRARRRAGRSARSLLRPRSTSRASAPTTSPEPRNLVDERHRGGQERVERVLGHLGRLDATSTRSGGENGASSAADAVARRARSARPRTTRSGLRERLDGLAQPQVLRAAGERRTSRRHRCRVGLLEAPHVNRPAPATRPAPARRPAGAGRARVTLRDHELDVGAVVLVHRRIERHPDDLGARPASAGSLVKRKRAALQAVAATRSSRPGSKSGGRPAARPATTSASGSSPTTS